jgi:hypothetical protein
MMKVVDRACKDIATARKATEITEGDVENFDKELNEMCNKWHEKFKDMDEAEFLIYMIDDLVTVSVEMAKKERNDGDK